MPVFEGETATSLSYKTTAFVVSVYVPSAVTRASSFAWTILSSVEWLRGEFPWMQEALSF